MKLKKAPTPKVDASADAQCPNGHRPLCWQTGWAFYLCLFLCSRKASSVMTKIPTETKKAAASWIVERISYAVIDTTSPLMYSLAGTKSGGLHSCHECFPGFHCTMDGKGWQCRFSRRFDNEFLSKQLLRYKHPCNFMPSPLFKCPSGLPYAP